MLKTLTSKAKEVSWRNFGVPFQTQH